MDLEPGLQKSVGHSRTFQIGGKSQGILQREMNELVRVGRRCAVVRLDSEPVTHALCDILCLYLAARADRVFPNGLGELWRIYGDDGRGSCGRYDGIKSGRCRYYNSRVCGVENKISTSKEDFPGGRHDCGRHCRCVRGLGRGSLRLARVEIVP